MKQIFLQKIWPMRHEFAKYFVIGVSGVTLDITSLYLLKSVLGITAVLAVVINQIFIINYVFALNKYWAFKSGGMAQSEIIKFYLVQTLNYLIAIAWMWIFSTNLGFNYLLARLANIILAVSWNFLIYKFFVFKKI